MKLCNAKIFKNFFARWPLLNKIASPAVASIISTLLNLLTTVVVVRFLGAYVYSSYVVDMSVLSLAFVVLEVVPSSYVIFRIQDDNRWILCLAPQVMIGITLSVLGIFILEHCMEVFEAFSYWMVLYAIVMTIKRQLDISLQAAGCIAQFFIIDAVGSALRLTLIFLFLYLRFAPFEIIWASLSLSMLVSQFIWISRNTFMMQQLDGIRRPEIWLLIWRERKQYSLYYLNIVLKRVRDSIVPIAANSLIRNKTELADFYIVYRGVQAAISQVRLVETVLNHRVTLTEFTRLSILQKIVVAAGTQLICLAGSLLIIRLAGIEQPPWLVMAILSILAWPVTFMMQERAQAHAAFKALNVTQSLLLYIISIGIGYAMMVSLNATGPAIFCLILLVADMVSWISIMKSNRRSL